jgi:hypothetical protein
MTLPLFPKEVMKIIWKKCQPSLNDFKTARIMKWRLAIEGYIPTLTWVPGTKNPIADFLSRHPLGPHTKG